MKKRPNVYNYLPVAGLGPRLGHRGPPSHGISVKVMRHLGYHTWASFLSDKEMVWNVSMFFLLVGHHVEVTWNFSIRGITKNLSQSQ